MFHVYNDDVTERMGRARDRKPVANEQCSGMKVKRMKAVFLQLLIHFLQRVYAIREGEMTEGWRRLTFD